MATCKFCLGRQEGTQFCWKKNKITNIINGVCPEYEHTFQIATIKSREKGFWGSVDTMNLTPTQRKHLIVTIKKEVENKWSK